MRVVVQVIDKAVQQLVGGMKIQLLGFARVALLERRAQTAHRGGQAVFISAELVNQPCGIRACERAAGKTVKHFGEVLQAGFDRDDHMIGGVGAQPLQQLVQGVEARRDAHEFAVEATEPPIAPTHVRVFKHGDAAQPFQAHGLGDKPHVAGLEFFTPATTAQAVGDKQREHAEALVQGIAHGGAGGLRQDRRADQRRANNPQGDFQHAPHCRHERAVGVRQRRQTDHRGRIAGQHKPIGTKVAVTRGTGGANAHPDRQRAQEQFGVLRKQGDQQHHHRRARQGAEQAIKTLGEHLAALRLHHDKHRDHGGAWLRQLQAHGQPQGKKRRDQHLEDIHPGHAVAACPVEEATAPFKGMQPAQRCRQGSHRNLLSGRTRPAPPGFCRGEPGRLGVCPCQRRGRRPGRSPVRHGRSGAPPVPAARSAAGETAGSGR